MNIYGSVLFIVIRSGTLWEKKVLFLSRSLITTHKLNNHSSISLFLTAWHCKLTRHQCTCCHFNTIAYYFGGARSKGFATLRNVSKLQFFDKIGQAKSVGFRLYSAIWRSESRVSSRYLEITSISLIYSLTFSRKKESLFWPSRGLNWLTCVTRQIRGDSKLRD